MKQVLIAVDQLVNTLLGGWADETLSSRAYRNEWKVCQLIDILFFWDVAHCKESYYSEKFRRQLPPELR